MDDEQRDQAQSIIDAAMIRIRDLGCGVVADGTVHGNGIWLDTLRVVERHTKKADAEPEKPETPAYSACCGNRPRW